MGKFLDIITGDTAFDIAVWTIAALLLALMASLIWIAGA